MADIDFSSVSATPEYYHEIDPLIRLTALVMTPRVTVIISLES